MSIEVKQKIKDIADDFAMPSKRVIEYVSKFYDKPKSSSQNLTEEQLNVIFDYITQQNQIDSIEQVFAVQKAQPAPAQEPAQEPAPEPAAAPAQKTQPQQGQQPQEAAPQQAPAAASARIINARGMADCRSAITLLRNGDAVLIVLENVTDPAEMRRLVDTLSGACYSLTATITKVSRYGVYLLAPQNVAVYADQATSQMNSAPNRSAVRAPQQQPYGNPGHAGYPQNNPYAAPQQNGFMQRPAAPEEAAQPFYTRTAPQAGQMPAFSTQPAAAGYAPDETMAVDQ